MLCNPSFLLATANALWDKTVKFWLSPKGIHSAKVCKNEKYLIFANFPRQFQCQKAVTDTV